MDSLDEKHCMRCMPSSLYTPLTVHYNTQITHCFSSATCTTTQVIVPGKYRRDFEDIQDRFAELFDEVAEILENEESVTTEGLKRFVSRIAEMKDSMDNAHTISDIIDIIQEHSSLTCCTHLKGVARRFKISAVTEKIAICE